MHFSDTRREDGLPAPRGLLHFHSSDPEEFSEALRPVAPGVQVMVPKHHRFRVDLKEAVLPQIGLFEATLTDARILRMPNTYLAITIPLDNALQFAEAGRLDSVRPGVAHLLWQGNQLDLRVQQPSRLLVCTFPQSLLRKRFAWGGESDLPRRIEPGTPDETALLRFMAIMWRELLVDGGLFRSVTATREIERTCLRLLENALASYSGTPLSNFESTSPDRAFRQALEFIEAHLKDSVTLKDIVEASGTSTSSLLRSFRRSLELTPMRYLKKRRLESVRCELLVADCEPGSVTGIALQHCFYQLGRFAADYRSAFGELPSETLRRGRRF